MESISLADVADGAARLRCDEQGAPVTPLVWVDLDDSDWSDAGAAAAALDRWRSPVVVGLSGQHLPPDSLPLLERLTCTLAPSGPGNAWAPPADGDVERVAATVEAAPFAAVTLAGLLWLTSGTSIRDGLTAESLAYSMLLAGPEFRAWRSRTPRRQIPQEDEAVIVERSGNQLSVVLNRPQRHNAFGRAVRAGVVDALEIAHLDASIDHVVITGAGPSFCSGGDLDEFGTTPDVLTAHVVRLEQSPGWAVHQLGRRVRVRVHGACIGAGIEVPAFAQRVDAAPDAWFRLPELGMGLVPGAGGTVSITRRIGRWRTAYLALVNRGIDVPTALRWGLIDGRA